jgi:hypothetical protein
MDVTCGAEAGVREAPQARADETRRIHIREEEEERESAVIKEKGARHTFPRPPIRLSREPQRERGAEGG